MLSDNSVITITPLRKQDLPAALNIQKQAYPPFLIEKEDAFLSRISLRTSYCFAAKRGKVLLGYLLAHGWAHQSPPDLGISLADDVPAEVLFIHDLAVASAGRGLKLGQQLIARAFSLGARDGLHSAELIAVEGAADYWRRLGFVESEISSELAAKLEAYGALACWMTREIPTGR